VLARLTDVPGSSAWVVGGVTAYANQVKVEQLGVPAALIAEHGAVSEPVALAMARGAHAACGADVAVSVTGIAGPTGGTDEKPVGTVVMGLVLTRPTPAGGVDSAPLEVLRTFKFIGDRPMVRQQATQAALDLVRRALIRT
jgi:nicotinamide-nucleotide amidase